MQSQRICAGSRMCISFYRRHALLSFRLKEKMERKLCLSTSTKVSKLNSSSRNCIVGPNLKFSSHFHFHLVLFIRLETFAYEPNLIPNEVQRAIVSRLLRKCIYEYYERKFYLALQSLEVTLRANIFYIANSPLCVLYLS
jgi:hypothetical protein